MIKKLTFQSKIKFVRFIDDIITLTQRLRLGNYIYALRIKKISGSLKTIDGGKNLVIFIVFEKNKLPHLTLEALKSFKEKGLQLLIVNNGNPKHDKRLLEVGADCVITRNNTGKDFGGYKDATLFLKKNALLDWKKIIYANDSVIYPKKIIDDLINELINPEYEFIAHSQVKEIHFHFQSFLFSCSESLINDPIFIKFWESYLPLDRRRYMIKNGEVGLTKKILKTGCSINVINTYQDLKKEFTDFACINEILSELPDRYRSQKSISETQLKLTETIIASNTAKTFRIGSNETKDLVMSSAITRAQATKAFYQNIAQDLYREISIGNPSHLGLSYFLRRNQPFVIKRDLAYRAGYDYDFLSSLLKKYCPDEYKNILAMIKHPSGNHYKGLKLFMFNQGMI
jgi:hypothetical protein